MPQSAGRGTRVDLSGSWLRPEAKNEDLLYAAVRHKIRVYSYTAAKIVGELDVGDSYGLCSDPKGDVFVDAQGRISEYAHGGSEPIERTKSKFGDPLQCAYDATTGNLAVIDTYFTGPDNVAIYHGLKGKVQEYLPSRFYNLVSCAYDGNGNLFVTGDYSATLGELPNGSGQFTYYKPELRSNASGLGAIQWDGQYLTVQELTPRTNPAQLDRITIAGKKAKVVSRTKLSGNDVKFRWLYAGVAIGFEGPQRRTIGYWLYPAGGHAVKEFNDKRQFESVTISVAP